MENKQVCNQPFRGDRRREDVEVNVGAKAAKPGGAWDFGLN